MTWWETDRWQQYEIASGEIAGARARLLETADWKTQVVDLSLEKAQRWSHVRRSYHSIIHAAERNPLLNWSWHGDGYCVACRNVCKDLHVHAAGRETRSPLSWELMDGWITSGNGHVVICDALTAGCDRRPIAYSYFIIHGRWSYYHSSVALEQNIGHALLWIGMNKLADRGVRWLEVGWLERDGETPKERQVAFFKSGFGGVAMAPAEAARLA